MKPLLLVFVDLDGTLVVPKINNTYDFIPFLCLHKIRSPRLVKLIVFIITKFLYTVAIVLSKLRVKVDTYALLVGFVFSCFSSKTLRTVSLYWIHLLFRERLIRTDIIEQVTRIKTSFLGMVEVFVLTCCVEYPACLLAEKFGFKCLSRELRKKGNLVFSLKDAHLCYITKAEKYVNIIKSFIKLYSQRPFTVYIVDDASANNEKPLLTLFNKVIIV